MSLYPNLKLPLTRPRTEPFGRIRHAFILAPGAFDESIEWQFRNQVRHCYKLIQEYATTGDPVGLAVHMDCLRKIQAEQAAYEANPEFYVCQRCGGLLADAASPASRCWEHTWRCYDA